MTQAAARHQLVPGPAQHRAVIRHGVVGKTEQHAIERGRRREGGGIAPHQLDIVPAIGIARPLCFAQHAGGNIDAIDAAGGPDSFLQIAETSAGAAADIEHFFAGAQPEAINRPSARILRQKKYPIK
jgi:hypothetical protein